MKFCPNCAHALEYRIPEGDNRKRYVCPSCLSVHYQNPRLVVGALPVWKDGRILLCLRAIEPRKNYWTLPAGFMENGETCEEGAARETQEEARARIRITRLFCLYDVPHVNQVHLIYHAYLSDLNFEPGPESLQVELFTPEEVEAKIQKKEIAFHSVSYALRSYLRHGLGEDRLFTATAPALE